MSTRNPYGDGPGYSQGQGMSETHTHDQLCQCERCEGVLGIKAYRQTVLTEDQRLREENDALKRELETAARCIAESTIAADKCIKGLERERDALTRRVEKLGMQREHWKRMHGEADEHRNKIEKERDALKRRVEELEKRANEGHAAHAASFGALMSIAMLCNLDGVDEYSDVVEAVRRIVDENAGIYAECDEAQRRLSEQHIQSDEQVSEINDLRARLATAEQALRERVRHEFSCEYGMRWMQQSCSCGLDEILRVAAPTP